MAHSLTTSHQLRSSFSKEIYDEVEETFRMLDTTGSHSITKSQLRLAEKVLGFAVDAKDSVQEVDNGELIDFEHYLTIVLEHMEKPLWIQSEAREAFTIFDKDGNGFLDAVEMKRVMTKIGEELTDAEIEDQLRHYDIDGDFQMMASEFVVRITNFHNLSIIFNHNNNYSSIIENCN